MLTSCGDARGRVVEVTAERSATMHITPALLERWFVSTAAVTERSTLCRHLARFKEVEVRAVQNLFTRLCFIKQ